MDTKLNGIELNSSKEAVRAAISGQILHVASAGALRNNDENCCILGATLPGDRFLFESQLHSLGTVFGMEIQFKCAELDTNRFNEALRHKPSYCQLAKTDFHNLLTTRFKYDEAGVAKQMLDPASLPTDTDGRLVGEYSFVWADYCCAPCPEFMKSLSQYAAGYATDGTLLLYATFSLPRGRTTVRSSLYEDMDHDFLKQLKKVVSAKLIKQVFSARYGGGKNYRSNMYTLGFAVGVQACQIDKIDLDLHWHKNLGYYQALTAQRKLSMEGITDYSLSLQQRKIIANTAKPITMKTSKVSNTDAAMKDAIEQIALLMRDKWLGDRLDKESIKAFNLSVWARVRKQFPRAALQNVSSTICVRVTRTARFPKVRQRLAG